MREATEKRLSKSTGHAMRAAAIRLARERAGEEPDPALTFGCVDWYRYDNEPQEAEPRPPAAAVPDACRAGAASGH